VGVQDRAGHERAPGWPELDGNAGDFDVFTSPRVGLGREPIEDRTQGIERRRGRLADHDDIEILVATASSQKLAAMAPAIA
jgi:hypothetical protein